MRADMSKVLVERPRIGSSKRRIVAKGYRQRLARDIEAGRETSRERMTDYRGNTTCFSEHLAPLRRFLQSQTGRPWNAVYSELCEHIDGGNLVQKHVLTHLFQYVERDVLLIDDVPYYLANRYGRISDLHRKIEGRYQWYVCPKTGLLKKAPDRKRETRQSRRNRYPKVIWVGKMTFCWHTSGGWQLITVKPFPAQSSGRASSDWDTSEDAIFGKLSLRNAWSIYGRPVLAAHVRPISKKELKNYPIPIELMRPQLTAPNIVR